MYHGSHYHFDDVVVDPHALQERVPIIIGGRTPRSLRRALELGDGWVPFGLALEELRTMLAAQALPEGFEVILSAGRSVDPIGDPEGTLRRLARVREAGATIVSASVIGTSITHYCEQLEALAPLAKEIR